MLLGVAFHREGRDGLYWISQVIAGSPVITLAGVKWITSLCELWELVSSWLTLGSLPASWQFILYIHVSVFSKDSGYPCADLGCSSPTNSNFSRTQPSCSLNLAFLSPHLNSASPQNSARDSTSLLHSLSYASRHKVRAIISLTLFVSILSGITDLVCLLSNVWKLLFHILCLIFQLLTKE